jgi:hypothetical protein
MTRAQKSLEATLGLIKRAQFAMVKYLTGDGPANQDINDLIEILDGPEQRAIQSEAEAALAEGR